jgi:hypothetical protein
VSEARGGRLSAPSQCLVPLRGGEGAARTGPGKNLRGHQSVRPGGVAGAHGTSSSLVYRRGTARSSSNASETAIWEITPDGYVPTRLSRGSASTSLPGRRQAFAEPCGGTRRMR